MPIQTKVILQGHLAKVRIDLDYTLAALTRWWDASDVKTESAALHTALEALLRAVSTIALVLEAELALVEMERQGLDRDDEAAYADIGCGDPTHMVPR